LLRALDRKPPKTLETIHVTRRINPAVASSIKRSVGIWMATWKVITGSSEETVSVF
jgi:hypothetical protein